MLLYISISFVLGLFNFSGEEPLKKAKLVWSDEFDNNGAPDSTKWTYDLGNGTNGWGNHEQQHYTKSSENVYVKDGILTIRAIRKDSEWTSARLKTQGKQTWTYGRFVFRAKLPFGKGTWPALWMLGESIATKGWPECGEIDIMEHVGNNPTVVQSAMHTPSSFGDTKDKNSTKVPTYDSEFHLYEANWTKDQIEFLVDGKAYYTYKPAVKDEKTWPFDQPFFIIMNIAIGGGLGGWVDPAMENAQMEVDYVRVYTNSKN